MTSVIFVGKENNSPTANIRVLFAPEWHVELSVRPDILCCSVTCQPIRHCF